MRSRFTTKTSVQNIWVRAVIALWLRQLIEECTCVHSLLMYICMHISIRFHCADWDIEILTCLFMHARNETVKENMIYNASNRFLVFFAAVDFVYYYSIVEETAHAWYPNALDFHLLNLQSYRNKNKTENAKTVVLLM